MQSHPICAHFKDIEINENTCMFHSNFCWNMKGQKTLATPAPSCNSPYSDCSFAKIGGVWDLKPPVTCGIRCFPSWRSISCVSFFWSTWWNLEQLCPHPVGMGWPQSSHLCCWSFPKAIEVAASIRPFTSPRRIAGSCRAAADVFGYQNMTFLATSNGVYVRQDAVKCSIWQDDQEKRSNREFYLLLK